MNLEEATMTTYRVVFVPVFGALLALAPAQAPPTQTKGVTEKLLATVDLGPEIEGMARRQLRMRLITIAPGGATAIHTHRDRPGTVYVLQGKITDYRDRVATEYGPGVGWPENNATTHWIRNNGTTPAVEISVDIFKQP
jgi:quercetin dioxygenase-like cupin family protein